MLEDDERKNYGISQSDMYQMYAYAKKYDSRKVFVIYPLNTEVESYEQQGIEFISEGILFKIIFFDLVNVDSSVSKIKQSINS